MAFRLEKTVLDFNIVVVDPEPEPPLGPTLRAALMAALQAIGNED